MLVYKVRQQAADQELLPLCVQHVGHPLQRRHLMIRQEAFAYGNAALQVFGEGNLISRLHGLQTIDHFG